MRNLPRKPDDLRQGGVGSRPRSVSRQSLCCTGPYLAVGHIRPELRTRMGVSAQLPQQRPARPRTAKNHPAETAKAPGLSQPLRGEPPTRRRPETGVLRAPLAAGKTGQAHTAPRSQWQRLYASSPCGEGRETLTVQAEDRPTLAKFMEGPRCGKAGDLGKPHRTEEREAWYRCAEESERLLEAPSPPSLLKCPRRWLPPASPTLRSSTNSSMTGQETPALPHPSAPFMEAGVLH